MAMSGDSASTERLLITLALAGIAHALLIWGVSFDPVLPEKTARSLDITLVRYPQPRAPQNADQPARAADQPGGAPAEKKAAAKFQPVPHEENTGALARPVRHEGLETKQKPLLQQVTSPKKIAEDSDWREEGDAAEKERPKISADRLSQQIAEFSAELSKQQEASGGRPRIRYINAADTHQYTAAAYERAWQDKIERIGNLNYPDEARRKKLSGSLLLSVGIKLDGSLYSVKVGRSSGYPALDEAALRIVRLAAPFSPLPDGLKDKIDVLVITRTWQFLSDHRMKTSDY